MSQRLNYCKAAPELLRAMMEVEKLLEASGIDSTIRHLVKIRASQINGCAFCIDMHWKDARAAGESEMRLYSLDAWRESPFYSEQEQAALEWTESLTRVSETHAPDDVFELVRAQFDDKQLAELTWAIAAINAWNRMAIGFRAQPGAYKPAPHASSSQ